MDTVRIVVRGTPAPKGSARAFVNKYTGKAAFAPGGSRKNQQAVKSWSAEVREAAAEAVGHVEVPPFVDVPLRVTMIFRVRRPASHWGKRGLKPSAPPFPAQRPDVDKYARATADAMTGTVYDDDGRIVEKRLLKLYAAPGMEGATIVVEQREPLSETETALLP